MVCWFKGVILSTCVHRFLRGALTRRPQLVVLEDLETVVTGAAQHVLRHRPINTQDLVMMSSQVVQRNLGAGTKRIPASNLQPLH